MHSFYFNTSSEIQFANGALKQASFERLGARVLFVTDNGLRKLGITESVEKALGTRLVIFDAVEADPSLETLMAAVDFGRSELVTGVLGLGGGSSMDVAKLVALLLGSGQDLEAAWGVGNATGPRLPLILVPTTSGTGSEVTPVAIITVGAEEKRGVSSPLILPDVAILDPELTVGLPPNITAATGVDAMVHAIEAYTSRNANNNPMSRMLAVQALDLLGANIETAVARGGNLEARGAMLMGSMLAGMAFANSPVAAVHALAYPIGGIFHVPHGLSNALILAQVMRFNAPECAAEYATLAPHVFPDIDTKQGVQAVCAEFIERLSNLSVRLGLPSRLRDVGIPEEACKKMAKDAMVQQRLLVNNPREVREEDALNVYRSAW
ncbi:MAG: iron-containing alcohol dehydrogenase [Paracoccaceae bacterium]|jgi:alcohol dehydrogenase class IV